MNEPEPLSSSEGTRPRGHESSDASPSSVGLFALGLVLVVGLMFPLLNWLLAQLQVEVANKEASQRQIGGSALSGDVAPALPKAPRLQSDPAADLKVLRREQDERLSTYGWINRSQKIVRIPVDRAIELLVERGLPERDGPRNKPERNEGQP